MSRTPPTLARWCAGAILVTGAIVAQEPRRTCTIGRIDKAAAPRIDGDLSDACWATATPIGELVSVLPVEGREPAEKTVVRVLHDRDNLYFACQCRDEHPETIRATVRQRDAELGPDDSIEILLDPFENRRTAYVFQVMAGGARSDLLVSHNGDRFDFDWDAVWSAATAITADGWIAEVAIPFRSLPRREGATSWGFNFGRTKRAPLEESQWANATRSVMFYRASQCGTLAGIGDIDSGLGIEVVPYAALGIARDRSAGERTYDLDPDAGGELYWRITPALGLAATLRTDFAETENDARQINLNRFPLFFPEKRDFFLDGSAHFAFGATDAARATVLPFFSRRIGLAADGAKVPVLAGAKLTGEVGPIEIGVLDVETDGTAALDETNLAVARVSYAIADATTVGVIGTHGDPTTTGANTVAGVDFHHRVARLVGDLDLRIHLDAMTSSGPGRAGSSFAYDVRSRGAEWAFSTSARWIDEDFAPTLGFVSHPGTRAFDVQAYHMPECDESSGVRNLDIAVTAYRRDYLHGGLQEEGVALEQLGLTWQNDDRAYAFARFARERVDTDFALFRGTTTVFAGDYATTRVGVDAATSSERAWDAGVHAETGGLFDGRMDQLSAHLDWRLSALVHLGCSYETSRIDLGPGRAFQTQIAEARCDLSFSPDLGVFNLVQFDNESNELGWQTRLRWTWSPGSDVFAVFGTSWSHEDDGALAPTATALHLKITHSLRF